MFANEPPRIHKGLTLLELLITLSISSLIMLFSLPGFTEFIDSYRADTIAQRIQAHLRLARSMAVTNGRRITICGSQNSTHCARSDIRYLLIFIDNNRDRIVDPGELAGQAIDLSLKKQQLKLSASLARPYIIYNTTGSVRQVGSFIYCPKSRLARGARRVTVNFAGRSFIAKDNDGDGIVETSRGQPISCEV